MSLTSLEARFYLWSVWDRYLWRDRPSASPRFAKRQALAEALQRRDGFDAPRPPQAMPEFDAEGFDRAAFLAASWSMTRPVVVRGFAADMPAARWDKSFLAEKLAGTRCLVYEQDRDSRARSWDVGTPLVEVEFAEYLEGLVDRDLYLNNSTELIESCPELEDDLDLERIRRTFLEPGLDWDELITANFFIGGRRVYSALHAAIGGNFFLNLVGRKRWTFVDPKYMPHLHTLTSRPFQYVKSAYGGSRGQELDGGDADHIFARVPRYEVVLEPGDLLYNAPWWLHEVDNLDDFTVGCAVRHMPRPLRRSPTLANHPLYTLTSAWPAGRAMIAGHYAWQKLTGAPASFRSLLADRQSRMLRQGLGRGQ